MLENFPHAYMPTYLADVTYSSITSSWKVIDSGDLHINDLFGIPSSLSLTTAEAANILDLRLFNEKQRELMKQKSRTSEEDLTSIDGTKNHCEDNLKPILFKFTPREQSTLEHSSDVSTNSDDKQVHEADLIKKHGYPQLDYEEALNYSHSKFAKLMRYYQHLERIFTLEWFIQKL